MISLIGVKCDEFKRVVAVHNLIFKINPLRQIISGPTGSIFTKFSPNGRYLIVD